MAIASLHLELSGSVDPDVVAVRINGQSATLADGRYRARIAIPATSSSVTLEALRADGVRGIRRLLVGEGSVGAPKASA